MSATVKIVSLARTSTAAADVSVAAPSSGSGWVVKGVVPFSDRHGPAVAVVFDNTEPANVVQTFTVDLAPTANGTVTKRVFIPRAGVLSSLAYYVDAKPASAGGSVLFNATKGVTGSGTLVLSAADFNAEAMADDTYTAFTLSGTPTDLDLAAGDFLEFRIVSNNVDMTAGTNLQIIGVVTLN